MESQDADSLDCPFCDFSDADAYFLTQHVELCHPEGGDSPFIVKDDQEAEAQAWETGASTERAKEPASRDGTSNDGYAECPHGCGEIITTSELPNHIDFHVAEEMALEDIGMASQDEQPGPNDSNELIEDRFATNISEAIRNHDHVLQPHSAETKGKQKQGGAGRTRRLGRSELGPHAHEKQMPTWLRKLLEDGTKVTVSNEIGPEGKLVKVESVPNETPHLIPALAGLCEKDYSVKQAFLCGLGVRHVFKLPKEGGFCGYRNIQMMVTYIQDARVDGHEQFPGRVPSIVTLQDMIEQAWDLGFNSTGRTETGGIRGTRKYIGTPEAQALFLSVGIRCEADAFSRTKDTRAHDALLVAIVSYFTQATSLETDKKVVQTNLPPIYLQHPGHSLTIVGVEIRVNGSANLLVLDPMFRTSPAMRRLLSGNVQSPDPTRFMRAYRRGGAYLQKYQAFEILQWVS